MKRAKRRCPRCRTAHRERRCPTCLKNRPSASARGYGPDWQAYRAAYLAQDVHKRCAICGAEATVVDHITPHRGDERLMWDATNHQPLCLPCNSRKGVTYEGGWGRAPRATAPSPRDANAKR